MTAGVISLQHRELLFGRGNELTKSRCVRAEVKIHRKSLVAHAQRENRERTAHRLAARHQRLRKPWP
jgi:hypothetical protein